MSGRRNAVSLTDAAAQPWAKVAGWAEYENFGVAAATRDSTRLALRERALAARRHAPLFDADAWALHYGGALVDAWSAHSAGGAMHVSARRRWRPRS